MKWWWTLLCCASVSHTRKAFSWLASVGNWMHLLNYRSFWYFEGEIGQSHHRYKNHRYITSLIVDSTHCCVLIFLTNTLRSDYSGLFGTCPFQLGLGYMSGYWTLYEPAILCLFMSTCIVERATYGIQTLRGKFRTPFRSPPPSIYYVSQFTVETYCFTDGGCLFKQP